MSNIVVIAPHADDEILGCGGTIAKHIIHGDSVYIIVASNAHLGAPELYSENQIAEVRTEALKAHKLLGISETYFLEFPAPVLQNYPNYKISNSLDIIIKKIHPRTVYLPHPGDLHTDHKTIFMSSLVVLRPISNVVQEIYTYETQSETEWAPPYASSVFFPTYFNELTNEEMDLKIKALKCFKTQLRSSPNPRSLLKIKSLAEYRGGSINKKYAEAFYVIRIINQ